jgi:hypothetical protein
MYQARVSRQEASVSIKMLRRTAFPLRSKAAGELFR